jgi:hypothetical protein
MTNTLPATIEAELVTFAFSDEVVDAFTHGDCWLLANTIQRLRGWSVVTVSGNEGGWIHAGNQLPDGTIIDINGINDVDDWVDEWADSIDYGDWAEFGGFDWAPWSGDAFAVFCKEEGHIPLHPASKQVMDYAQAVISLGEKYLA